MTESRPGKAAGNTGKLTEREGILWDALLAGKSLRDAAREAGYSEECLGQSRWRTLQGIKATMHEILARHGLTAVVFALKLKELIDAKDKKFFSYKGRIFATRVVPAYRIRLSAIDIWARILGLYEHPEPVQSGRCAITVVHNPPLRPVENPALPAGSGMVTSGVTPLARKLLAEKNE